MEQVAQNSGRRFEERRETLVGKSHELFVQRDQSGSMDHTRSEECESHFDETPEEYEYPKESSK